MNKDIWVHIEQVEDKIASVSLELLSEAHRLQTQRPNPGKVVAVLIGSQVDKHVPLLEETAEMFNKEMFDKVKPGLRLLNFSRDGLVNNKDVIDAIDEGKITCYVTDFPTEELVKHKKIIAIPHLGASTLESEENCAVMASNQMKDYLENGNIINSVNLPHCEMIWNTKWRLTFIHKNVPNIIGQITAILAGQKINIVDMMNKSSGDWAYTIIDTPTEITEAILSKLEKIDGVIRARLLCK